MTPSRLIILVIFSALIATFFLFDLQQYLSLEFIKAQQDIIEAYWRERPVQTVMIFILCYVAMTGLSLPGATVLTLLGGAIFGLLWGTVIVSFASTIGATLAFLASRFLFRESIKDRFKQQLAGIDEGMERDGAFYLFTLRLVPVVPFFLINLSMGLTAIRLWTFCWVSQIGMLAGTVVYINAGTQLARLETLSGILSLPILGSFVLLGIFPLCAKKLIAVIEDLKVYRGWRKPAHFDYNLVVIGAGSGGLVSAYIAAAVKAKVALVEKHKMGGDCLNTGCVPSKALLRTARWVSQVKRHQAFGINKVQLEVDFETVMQRVQNVISQIAPHDSVERYNELGVDVVIGDASIKTPWEVQISTDSGLKTLTTRAIVIAAGARPFVPPVAGLEHIDFLTSDTIWNLKALPKRLLVLGGGPIGCELTQCFARLGSRVTQVEMLPRIMAREDPDVSAQVMARFKEEGVDLRVGYTARLFKREEGEQILVCEHQGQRVEIAFDQVLIAIGRAANVKGYGIDSLGITLSPRKTIATNPFQQTNYPNIYAVGDVAGPYQFTHTAAHQAWYAAVNALFGRIKKFRTDYSIIPWATFTDPEVARVGINEQEAKQQNIPYEVVTYGLDELDRAITESEAHGFVKVLTRPGKDHILGVTIVGQHAGDLIAEFVLAMKHDIGLNKLLGTIHIYPTWSEANKYVAGVWKRQHAPAGLLRWLARYHAWFRH